MFTNSASLRYTISFADGTEFTGRVDTTSHSGEIVSHYRGLAEPAEHQGALTGFQHEQDAEKQAVNIFANRLYRHLRCTSDADYRARIRTVRRGRIELFSTLGPCHSCRHVIRTCLADFPAVTMEVRYRNSTRRGGTARLLPAGEGLHGAYGYDDATQPDGPNGSWCRIFPGRHRTLVKADYAIRFRAPLGQEQGPLARGSVSAVAGTPYTPFAYRSADTSSGDEVAQVLDGVARQLRTMIGGKAGNRELDAFRLHMLNNVVSGKVTLTADQGPTQAGRAAMDAFNVDFPRVDVEFAYEGQRALVDGVGYRDAQQLRRGRWLKAWRVG
jgi:hypothetical protein